MKLVVAITGASGAIYAENLLQKLSIMASQWNEVAVVFSDKGREVWQYELDRSPDDIPFKIYKRDDFFAPFASGSAGFDGLIVCPCSMGTLGRIAHGISDDLINRTADVMLKEHRKLILITRETPLNLIHINNMKTVTEAGAIICPASPSFYSKPQTISEIISTVTNRALSLAGLEVDGFKWNS
jgi:4-hydroxy-3-polyprenylbenzoate decarboxylase